jgi:pimeloyl-ACP methyl ester carboxylesterase
MQRNYCRTEYGNISYLDGLEGYPILFMHGLGGTGNSWLKAEPFLDESIRPIFVDLLGHGHSDKPKIEYSINQQAHSVAQLINNLGLKSFSIAGNSYGGWISLKLASGIAAPDILFLVDSAGISPAWGEENPAMVSGIIEYILKYRNYNNRDALENIMKNNRRPCEKITDDELMNIKCSTTIIWGKNDDVIPIDYGYKLKEKITGSEIIPLDNAGHTPFIDRPEEFTGIINGKIRELNIC